jgi:peptidoglycan/LPS O-acetylase OafA/YrhL
MLVGDAVSRTVAPYLGIGAMFVLLSIWDGKPGNSMQDFFGRASYHLFIGHMPIAAVLVTDLKLTQESLVVFLSATVISLALSAGLVPIERYINISRQRIQLENDTFLRSHVS